MIKRFVSLGIAAFAFSNASVFASPAPGRWTVDLNQGSGGVEFDATGHPSALKIVGKGAAPRGNLQVQNGLVSGVVSLDLNSLDTGVEMRTKHMKEKYLETGKYQQAKLTIKSLPLPQGSSVEQLHAEALPFSGTLSLHGVERPVSGTAKIDANGGKLAIAANFALKVSDYQIAIPTFAGITMADDVKVLVTDSAPLSKL